LIGFTVTGTQRLPRERIKEQRRAKSASAAPPLSDTAFITEEFLPYLLTQTANLWNRNFKHDLKHVNAKQWRVLAAMSRGGRGAKHGRSLNELVDATVIDQSTLSRMIPQLSARGLVRRETSDTDGRFVRLSLTPKGKALVEAVWPIAWRHYRIGAAGLNGAEEAVLAKLLLRVRRNLRQRQERRSKPALSF
jgi:DNA-binding MarR family transcriptional regulator